MQPWLSVHRYVAHADGVAQCYSTLQPAHNFSPFATAIVTHSASLPSLGLVANARAQKLDAPLVQLLC